jgi:hypothetical protein
MSVYVPPKFAGRGQLSVDEATEFLGIAGLSARLRGA